MHVNVTSMVTRIHQHAKGRYYLRAHFKASGMSRDQLAGQMGMAPESVSRLMKNADEYHRISGARLHQFADIMGVTVNDLRLPPRPKGEPKPLSLDEQVKDKPDLKRMIELMVAGYKSS